MLLQPPAVAASSVQNATIVSSIPTLSDHSIPPQVGEQCILGVAVLNSFVMAITCQQPAVKVQESPVRLPDPVETHETNGGCLLTALVAHLAGLRRALSPPRSGNPVSKSAQSDRSIQRLPCTHNRRANNPAIRIVRRSR